MSSVENYVISTGVFSASALVMIASGAFLVSLGVMLAIGYVETNYADDSMGPFKAAIFYFWIAQLLLRIVFGLAGLRNILSSFLVAFLVVALLGCS